MSWIILGLVFLAVTYLSLKGTIIEEYEGRNYVGECHVPIWVLLVLGLLYIVPVLGIILFIAYNVTFLIHAMWEPKKWSNRHILKLSNKNVLHKILTSVIHFLTKDI